MSVLGDWAESGAVALTGRPDGPPQVPPGRAATWVREQLAVLGVAAPGLLGERAAYAGLHRSAPWSCGGAFRVLHTVDGHVGLSLARPDDLALVPALVEADVEGGAEGSGAAWAAVDAWAQGRPTAEVAQRMSLLGLPGGAVPTVPEGPAVQVTPLGRRAPAPEPLVVDMTGLWAGPLCAHLLGLTGARVVKVESRARPDGARRGPRDFFDLLHAGHEELVLDLPTDVEALRALVREADLVLESSRPRAMRHLGLVAEDVVQQGTSWLSITAQGRTSLAVGFGDDVAAAAGLVVREDETGDVLPAGDALADPLAGVAAAVAAAEALASEDAVLIDVSMLGVAAQTSGPTVEHLTSRDGEGQWWVEDHSGRFAVAAPRRRECC